MSASPFSSQEKGINYDASNGIPMEKNINKIRNMNEKYERVPGHKNFCTFKKNIFKVSEKKNCTKKSKIRNILYKKFFKPITQEIILKSQILQEKI